MINSVTMSGYIPIDANVRQSKKGDSFCAFTLLARSGFSDRNTKEVAVPCISFGKIAEKLIGCKAGTTVVVEGFLEHGMDKDDVNLQLAVKNIEVYDMVKGKPLDKKADNNKDVFKIDADDLPF